MNILRKSILIGFTVLGMAAAHAQDTAPQNQPHRGQQATPEQRHAKMDEMYAKRQARLHDKLKITAQQESAWATYQAAIKPTAPAGPRPARGEFAKLSSPERLSKMIEMTKLREGRMQQQLTALTAFYDQLTPEQKVEFDKRGGRGFGGFRHGGERGHRMHRG
jgi:Spy/CpxP family protein refolding chaperone